ncbi:hypothetical protein D9623_07875 [Azospirillum brasilense]|uniref:DNA-binding protein n=1 Tax=Azospirillum brasilense TaxID=192 RepID=A0A0P0EHM5_AZOBR|nr:MULTISPECIES: hypothetical protein [Azospirillum]ALJ35157.1 hypothetical protein AMK58_06820 [Azospirillum brasilense]MDW7553661.1 hypothetical protein [Azospirillum brasilense]MDW7594132.1 hypothetical protein [Azospirillum brasilense]MDW7629003.1 hypothetical protein [Azospirillum brasilense]MDX5953852.1 hypothetical protein [Azospirillum brasilense]
MAETKTSIKRAPKRPMRKTFRLAYSVEELAMATSMSRTKIFDALRTGALKGKKLKTRTIILRRDALSWLKGLPDWA